MSPDVNTRSLFGTSTKPIRLLVIFTFLLLDVVTCFLTILVLGPRMIFRYPSVWLLGAFLLFSYSILFTTILRLVRTGDYFVNKYVLDSRVFYPLSSTNQIPLVIGSSTYNYELVGDSNPSRNCFHFQCRTARLVHSCLFPPWVVTLEYNFELKLCVSIRWPRLCTSLITTLSL